MVRDSSPVRPLPIHPRSSLGLVLLLSLLLAAPPAGAVEANLPRHPAPSPDGTEIAFSWQGDLWIVAAGGGDARRLTVHPGVDIHPVWSRDGRSLAFSSDRFGSTDVFVLPIDASAPPTRLTWASVGDRPVDFRPDGSAVTFTSRRQRSIRRSSTFYEVDLEGGTPRVLQAALGQTGAWSPDGEVFAFVRGVTPWTRHGYRGAANRDLWLRRGDSYQQITDFDGDDDSPAWIDGTTLAFLSERAGRKNLFRLDLDDGEAVALTSHQESDVRWPRASADGRLLAYELENEIWTVPADGSREPAKLNIQVPADFAKNPVDRRVDRDGADELAVSPDGKLAAFLVHGDVFLTEITSKDDQEIAPPRTVRVTSTPEREADLSWSPDGESLLVTSYSTGQGDLYRIRAGEGLEDPADDEAEDGDEENAADPRRWLEAFDHPWTRLTDSEEPEFYARFSPDGKRVAFVAGNGDLRVIDADGGEATTLLEGWLPPDFEWSPDSRWLTYSVDDLEFNTDVWILSVDGGEPYNVSRHPDNDDNPYWSADGKRLLWTSERHGDSGDLWGVWLAREDEERTPEGWLRYFKDDKKGSGKGSKGPSKSKDSSKAKDSGDGKGEDEAGKEEEEEEEEAAPEPVVIDFEHLWQRSRSLTDLRGNETQVRVTPDGKRVLFSAEQGEDRDLFSVRWDGEDLKRLTQGNTRPRGVHISADGKTVYFLDNRGTLKRIGLDGKAGDPMPFAARHEVDRRQEQAVVFDEVWLALNQRFYDPDFHGVDWRAQRERYRPWALQASHPRDFGDMVNLMLGELNASHMGYFRNFGGDGETTGYLGAFFDPAAGGPGLLVEEVLRGSPATRVDVDLEAGDRLLAVDGEEIDPQTNIYRLFVDTVGRPVRLAIQEPDGSRRTALATPVNNQEIRRLRYRQWTEERGALTEKYSGGRLGYLHIQAMNMDSFEEFERNLYAAGHGKEGLIIDVRSNGGGWTTDYLMAALNVRRHARTVPRDGDPEVNAYPQPRLPVAAWTRPAAALADEESYSNAEIFSWAFQSLDRGPLIGNPTFGAVISTGGTRVLDGGFVRLPFRGWFVAGSDINMEKQGAVPDVIVPRPPNQDTSAEEDDQLARAVQELLEGLESDPRYGAW